MEGLVETELRRGEHRDPARSDMQRTSQRNPLSGFIITPGAKLIL